MNPHIIQAKRNIYREGIPITFIRIVEGAYDTTTGSVTNTEVSTSLIAFPKKVKTNQYNFPNLIGREVKEYLIVASDLANAPQPMDKITQGSTVYTVDSVSEHVALGEVVLYKVIVYKG